jgi:hypothetical protein
MTHSINLLRKSAIDFLITFLSLIDRAYADFDAILAFSPEIADI